ncbi:MAG: threonine--tRNA ligase [bacterium]|nr:threonine--tRNA ligase [bacterium]
MNNFNEEEMKTYWHSTSHILAGAVKELFPDVKLGIGPAIDNGFYYDFDLKHKFTEDDLKQISAKMQEIINANYKFERKEITKDDALKLFQSQNEIYKVELIKELEGAISVYTQGNFTDLCRGPHIESTGMVKAFKLLSVAGAYWKGDEKNPMLQRIYGISHPDIASLEDALKKLEEAKLRDHRKLGKELEIFEVFEEVGPGLVCWLPNGRIIRKSIETFWEKEHTKRGYQIVTSPHIAKAGLWETSGHLKFYEHMTKLEFGGDDYVLKPMNCVFHILIYKNKIHSYKELPIRYAELGTVYRCEKSGVVQGLLRMRGFTQDDAHIFCREDQVKDEVSDILELTDFMMKTFGFNEYHIDLSVRDPKSLEKYAGSNESWELAEQSLAEVLNKRGLKYKRAEGEAVFYGPKIDIKLVDALGRQWQATTIQFDFNLPSRFDVTYVGEDNKPHPIIMIHRTILGSMERFIGCLIEQYNGAFPFWLSPTQVVIATVSQELEGYAKTINEKLLANDIRVKLDLGAEKIGAKIRNASMKKIPYILIIGNKEKDTNTVSVREHGKGDTGVFGLDSFIDSIKEKSQPACLPQVKLPNQ